MNLQRFSVEDGMICNDGFHAARLHLPIEIRTYDSYDNVIDGNP